MDELLHPRIEAFSTVVLLDSEKCSTARSEEIKENKVNGGSPSLSKSEIDISQSEDDPDKSENPPGEPEDHSQKSGSD
jgi:hypothetical protein